MDSRPAQEALADCLSRPVGSWTLTEGALAIARLKNPGLDAGVVFDRLDHIGWRARKAIGGARHPRFVAAGLARVLFEREGFIVVPEGENSPETCFLDYVLATHQVTPTLMALMFVEIARRVGSRFEGVAIPGHFLLRSDSGGKIFLFDPANRVRPVSLDELKRMIRQVTGDRTQYREGVLRPVSPPQFLARLVGNLKAVYWRLGDFAAALAAVGLILTIRPDDPREIRDRGRLLFQMNRFEEAIAAFEAYLTINPRGEDAEVVRLLLVEARRKR